MPQSSRQFPHNPYQLPGKTAKQGLALERKIYILRAVFCFATLTLLAVDDALCRGRPGDHLWLLVAGLLYPHIGHLLFGRMDVSRRRGHMLFLVDGLFIGAVIGALQFSFLPCLVLAVISLFNWMVVGGPILIALGLGFLFAGMLTTGTSLGNFDFGSATSCNAVNLLASSIALGYFLIVARIVHRLVGELRLQQVAFQARSDAASSASAMAEQALLATLPASAARQMAENGQFQTEVIRDATMLLLDFAAEDRYSLALDDLKNAFHVATMILARHGIELVKTFGSRAIAVGRQKNAHHDAIKAFLEIDNFINDHRRDSQERAHLALRGKVHLGTLTMGLVQPERLNLDLFGDAVNQLLLLPTESASSPAPMLIVSASVYRKLDNPADFVPTPHGSYIYAPHQVS